MKRAFLSLVLMFLCSIFAFSENIVKYEYWFNNDFGSKIEVNITATNNLIIDTVITIPEFDSRFVFIHIRSLDDKGNWSAVTTNIINNEYARDDNIIMFCEYWFNNDNVRKKINFNQPVVNLDTVLTLIDIPKGESSLHLRFVDKYGLKSSVVSYKFYNPMYNLDNEIDYCEYWFNDDSIRTAINITPNLDFNLDTLLSTANLPKGEHKFHIRYRDKLGSWSEVTSTNIRVPASAIDNEIVYCEYWFDKQTTRSEIELEKGKEVEIYALLDASQLIAGSHILNLRLKDSYGNWTPVETHFFNSPLTNTDNFIVYYEYWFENDIDNMVKVNMEVPEPMLKLSEMIEVPDEHLNNPVSYFIRFRDIRGNWSPVYNASVEIPEILPPYLIAPDLAEENVTIFPNFIWNNIDAAIQYIGQISLNSTFTSIVKEFNTTAASYKFREHGLKTNTIYYWRVKARFNDNVESVWSEMYYFNTNRAEKLPDHWTVIETDNFAEIMLPKNINPEIGTRNFQFGDGLGVFYNKDGKLTCGGYGIWNGNDLLIKVWGNDAGTPEKDGFSLNENYTLRTWDGERGREYETEATYSSGNPFYTVNGYSVIGELNVIAIFEHSIPFTTGWNLISSYIEPENSSILTIWNDIKENIVIVKNNAGASYIPAFDIDDIKNWKSSEGYQVFASQADTLVVTGLQIVPENSPINLNAGWNTISYIRDSEIDCETAFASITVNGNLVIVKDNFGNTYIPAYDINSIGNLVPGQGYQIYVLNNDELVYPAN